MACKPDSVPGSPPSMTIPLAPPLPTGSSCQPGPAGAKMALSCDARSLFGIAPGGACRAGPVASPAVGSYPTVSPLPAANRRRSHLCGAFPGVAPAGRYPAPYLHGVRTFLDVAAAVIRPSARGPDRPGRHRGQAPQGYWKNGKINPCANLRRSGAGSARSRRAAHRRGRIVHTYRPRAAVAGRRAWGSLGMPRHSACGPALLGIAGESRITRAIRADQAEAAAVVVAGRGHAGETPRTVRRRRLDAGGYVAKASG